MRVGVTAIFKIFAIACVDNLTTPLRPCLDFSKTTERNVTPLGINKVICTRHQRTVYHGTLHRLVRRNFQRRRTVVSGVDDQWQADLIDLPNPKMFNNGHTFMLIVVEKFSNFAWAEPLKNKTGKSILKAFAKILNRGSLKTLFLYTDRGLEFVNKLFQR